MNCPNCNGSSVKEADVVDSNTKEVISAKMIWCYECGIVSPKSDIQDNLDYCPNCDWKGDATQINQFCPKCGLCSFCGWDKEKCTCDNDRFGLKDLEDVANDPNRDVGDST